MKKIKLNRENGIQIGGKTFISLLKAIQITSKVLKEKKSNYDFIWRSKKKSVYYRII